VLIALLVFVPFASASGSWASPAPVAALGTPAHHGAIAPAQLIPPTGHSVPRLTQFLLLIAGAVWLCFVGLPRAAAGPRLREPIPPPGRRGRALLQAYLD
jgi:hypothetical protein